MTVRLFLTFDYEVFLGKNYGSEEEVLFGPTTALLETAREVALPLNFFADVGSVAAYSREGQFEYVRRFEAQLASAVADGHDVQLHVHSHWAWANWSGSGWLPDPAKLNSWDLEEEEERTFLRLQVRSGVSYLESLLRPVDPRYRCVAFRAGGLGFGRRPHLLSSALAEAGIRIDSSVVKELAVDCDTAVFDYSRTPPGPNWRFPATAAPTVESKEGIYEIPIATFRMSLLNQLSFLLGRARAVGRRRGETLSRRQEPGRLAVWTNLLVSNLRYLQPAAIFVASCDTKGMTRSTLVEGFTDYIRRHEGLSGPDGVLDVSLLCHPKLMFREELELLVGFTEDMKARFGEQLTCARFRDVG